jgi:hypothetical protein
MARKSILDSTIKRLYALSGNRCAFPGCTITFVDTENDTKNLSNICHIEAAEPGGERYNPSSNDDERRGFENLILLCPTHHAETDNVSQYTVEVLRKMKQEHEAKMLQPEVLQKYSSALNIVIDHIGRQFFDDANLPEPQNAPVTEDKILYNNVVRFKLIIEEYSRYQGWLSKIYEEIEIHGSAKKEMILRNIKYIYLLEKSNYGSIDEIRANADNIIEKVKNELWKIIESSHNTNADMPFEAIQIGLLIILVDAFMRCNILEEPPKV